MRIFTDDGTCVADAGLMRRALEYARALPGAVLAQHCEDPALARDGHMHEGAWSSLARHPRPSPAEAESVVVARDIALAGLTGGPRPLPPPVGGRLGRTGRGRPRPGACR